MNSFPGILAVIIVLASGVAGVRADDSPSVSGVGQPSGNSSLDEARLAIKAKDWKKALALSLIHI